MKKQIKKLISLTMVIVILFGTIMFDNITGINLGTKAGAYVENVGAGYSNSITLTGDGVVWEYKAPEIGIITGSVCNDKNLEFLWFVDKGSNTNLDFCKITILYNGQIWHSDIYYSYYYDYFKKKYCFIASVNLGKYLTHYLPHLCKNVEIKIEGVYNSSSEFPLTTSCTQYYNISTCQPDCGDKVYGINYYANGGNGVPDAQKWTGNLCTGTQQMSSKIPYREGYEFMGWSEDKYATFAEYQPGGVVSYDHEEISLYAVWKPIEEPTTKPVEALTTKPTEQTTTSPAEFPRLTYTDATTKPEETTEKPIEIPVTKLDETTTMSVDVSTTKSTEPTTTKPVEAPTNKPTESTTTKPVEVPTTKPGEATTKPENTKIELVIRKPSETTINYGDSIVLHADVDLPAGAKVVWTADNENFSYAVSEDGKTCTITPAASGDTTFTATIVDKDGKVISNEATQTMTSKAGFFQKIIAFFKNLFGLTKVIPEAFKLEF